MKKSIFCFCLFVLMVGHIAGSMILLAEDGENKTSQEVQSSQSKENALLKAGQGALTQLSAFLPGGTLVIDPGLPIFFEAEQIDYDVKNDIMHAKGGIEILHRNFKITTDEIVFNQKSGMLSIKGNFNIFFQKQFFLSSDDVSFDVRKKHAELSNVSFIVVGGTLKLLAGKAVFDVEKGEYSLSDAVITSCPTCPTSLPLWSIHADHIRYNQTTHRIYYSHMFLDIKGVPIFYTPYFAHQDGTIKRKTGFLFPKFFTNDNVGFALETPFFCNISDDKDITFYPRISLKNNHLLRTRYRQAWHGGDLSITPGIAFAQLPNDTKHEWHGLVDAKLRHTWSPIPLSAEEKGSSKAASFHQKTVINIKHHEDNTLRSFFELGDQFIKDELIHTFCTDKLQGRLHVMHYDVRDFKNPDTKTFLPNLTMHYRDQLWAYEGEAVRYSSAYGMSAITRLLLDEDRAFETKLFAGPSIAHYMAASSGMDLAAWAAMPLYFYRAGSARAPFIKGGGGTAGSGSRHHASMSQVHFLPAIDMQLSHYFHTALSWPGAFYKKASSMPIFQDYMHENMNLSSMTIKPFVTIHAHAHFSNMEDKSKATAFILRDEREILLDYDYLKNRKIYGQDIIPSRFYIQPGLEAYFDIPWSHGQMTLEGYHHFEDESLFDVPHSTHIRLAASSYNPIEAQNSHMKHDMRFNISYGINFLHNIDKQLHHFHMGWHEKKFKINAHYFDGPAFDLVKGQWLEDRQQLHAALDMPVHEYWVLHLDTIFDFDQNDFLETGAAILFDHPCAGLSISAKHRLNQELNGLPDLSFNLELSLKGLGRDLFKRDFSLGSLTSPDLLGDE